MRFTTEAEAKKWLRGMPLLKKELELKIGFYEDLIRDNKKMGTVGKKHIEYYAEKVACLQEEIKQMAAQMDEVLSVLSPEERMIMTARYLRGLFWDVVELHVHYSRRQAIRIHNQAITHLVGVELGGKKDEKRRNRKTKKGQKVATAGC